jgi:hypothetical protein
VIFVQVLGKQGIIIINTITLNPIQIVLKSLSSSDMVAILIVTLIVKKNYEKRIYNRKKGGLVLLFL